MEVRQISLAFLKSNFTTSLTVYKYSPGKMYSYYYIMLSWSGQVLLFISLKKYHYLQQINSFPNLFYVYVYD